jgi:hypothetical protein|tara:strand:+ start:893 stop:1072 length:180 start_codon:yes stop_codon:yes gene_type:complete
VTASARRRRDERRVGAVEKVWKISACPVNDLLITFFFLRVDQPGDSVRSTVDPFDVSSA